ncbi:MAG: extracellular solute-binding protein [Firmicutes bacterium]|nr:extracellular solute-binding protein [Bacillota bacterium]
MCGTHPVWKKLMLMGIMWMLMQLLSLVPAQAKTIQFWTMNTQPQQIEAFKQLLAQFEQQNPDIKVEVQQVPWNGYKEKFLTAFQGGSPPDVSQMGTTKMAFFAGIGALLPLDDLVHGSGLRDKMFTNTWDACTYDKRVYGVPWIVDTRIVVYRKDWFQELGLPLPTDGWTWDDFLRAAQKINGNGRFGFAGPMSLDNRVLHNFSMLLGQNGGHFLDKTGKKAIFNSPAGIEALEFYTGLLTKHHVAPPGVINYSRTDEIKLFAAGKVGMSWQSPNDIMSIIVQAPDLKDKLGFVVTPMKKQKAGFLGGSDLVIWKSPHTDVEAAAKLIAFLASHEGQTKYCSEAQFLPARKDAYDDPLFSSDIYRVCTQELQYARDFPNIIQWSQIEDLIKVAVNKTAARITSAKQALDEAVRSADEALQR